MVEVVVHVVGAGGIGVLQKIVVLDLVLGAGGAFGVRRVGVEQDDPAEASEHLFIVEIVLDLDATGGSLLGVEGLEAVGGEVVEVGGDAGLAVGT